MFEKKLGEGLGKITKATLRAFTGKSRMTQQQYYTALDEYNAEVDRLHNQERTKKEQLRKTKDKLNSKLRTLATGQKQQFNLKIVPFISKFSNPVQGFKYILSQIKNIPINAGKKIDIKYGGKYYSINNNTINNFAEQLIDENVEELYQGLNGSDAEFFGYVLNASDNDNITIQVYNPTNRRNNQQGDFFKYYHNTHYDFTRYGIHNEKPKSYPENCIIEALQYAGLSNEKLIQAKLLVSTKHFPKCKLNTLAEKLSIKINLTTIKDNARTESFGEGDEYNIALYDEHYFVNETTNNTHFSIEHYEEVKDIKNSNNIKSLYPRVKRDTSKYINSLSLVKLLLENKNTLLRDIPCEDLFASQYYDRVQEDFSTLEYEIKTNTEPVKNSELKQSKSKIIFFDFETISINTHIPYLCCILNDELKKSFIGEDCGLQMLKYLSSRYDDVLLIAHNASYDFRFILQYINQVEECSNGTSIYSVDGRFNKMKLSIKDSYKLITMPLKKFPSTFGIKNTIKEVISYNFYNETDAIKNRWMPIELMKQYLLKEGKDIEQFENNILRWNIIDNYLFDAIEYSRRYCEIDCEILQQGYNTFRNWMLELTNLDINNILTIASLAHRYLIEDGCYEGVYNISGIPRAFIQRCVVGGRVMCANNEKKIYTGKSINDFDAVSLYPSAMARMEGFLKGVPKVLNNLTYNFIKNQSGYFIEIVIKSVGKQRTFPLMSYKNEQGIRIFSNDMVGKTLYVDKTSLEDLIVFQNIEFDIIRGYYFDEGYNKKINSTITHIFNERLRLKKEGNPAEMVYKLIMNSAYGKSIMKPRDDEIRYFDNEEKMNVYKSRHYSWIKTVEKIANSNLWRVKSINPLSEHQNIAHIGVCVLSMSKRIMNEVMCCAEDNGIELFYQDTDSMHLYADDIKTLSTLFETKYNRQLIGKKLGQFHSDFDLEGCEDVMATRSIFLGKKCYIDELQGKDKNGNIKTGYHIRMKGVPASTIKHTAKKMNINIFELYQKLYDGEKIYFDLTEEQTKSNFKFHSNGLITTLMNFTRQLSF